MKKIIVRKTGYVSGEFEAEYRKYPLGKCLEHTRIWKHRHNDNDSLVSIVFKIHKKEK